MIKRFLLISLAGLITTVVAMTNYHRFKSIDWRPATDVETFAATIGHGCEAVHDAIDSRLGTSFRGMRPEPAITSTTDMDEEVRWYDPYRSWADDARAVAGEGDHTDPYEWEQYIVAPELQRYFDLPPSQRGLDFMLLHDGQRWDSEYYYRGAPAPFLSNFIIHLACDDPAATTVQIYEYGAQICVGEWFGLRAIDGHTMPSLSFGHHPDCRLVPATRGERAELLRQIQALF